MRATARLVIATVAFVLFLCAAVSAETGGRKSAPCSSAEYHQFDFWLGDWDAYDVSNLKVVIARNHVERILDGCVVREDYQQNDGMHGEGFNIFEANTKTWRQSWVTNRGKWLLLEGGMEDGAMVLTAHDEENGKPILIRGTWKVEVGGVRETAVKSTDGGKTWNPWFDIVFRPHKDSKR